ncbi:MAG: hypothetical protein MHM6MM_007902 [Cercozoa sp. M6MM]
MASNVTLMCLKPTTICSLTIVGALAQLEALALLRNKQITLPQCHTLKLSSPPGSTGCDGSCGACARSTAEAAGVCPRIVANTNEIFDEAVVKQLRDTVDSCRRYAAAVLGGPCGFNHTVADQFGSVFVYKLHGSSAAYRREKIR